MNAAFRALVGYYLPLDDWVARVECSNEACNAVAIGTVINVVPWLVRRSTADVECASVPHAHQEDQPVTYHL